MFQGDGDVAASSLLFACACVRGASQCANVRACVQPNVRMCVPSIWFCHGHFDHVERLGHELVKLFKHNSTEHYFLTAQNNNYDIAIAFKHSDAVFILLINVKMPTVVGILTFMSRIRFLKTFNIDVWFLRLFSSRVYVAFFVWLYLHIFTVSNLIMAFPGTCTLFYS